MVKVGLFLPLPTFNFLKIPPPHRRSGAGEPYGMGEGVSITDLRLFSNASLFYCVASLLRLSHEGMAFDMATPALDCCVRGGPAASAAPEGVDVVLRPQWAFRQVVGSKTGRVVDRRVVRWVVNPPSLVVRQRLENLSCVVPVVLITPRQVPAYPRFPSLRFNGSVRTSESPGPLVTWHSLVLMDSSHVVLSTFPRSPLVEGGGPERCSTKTG